MGTYHNVNDDNEKLTRDNGVLGKSSANKLDYHDIDAQTYAQK